MYCETCTNKTCLITKRPCKEVESLLPNNQTGRLKGEFSLNLMDETFSQELDGTITDKKSLREQRKGHKKIDY